MSTIVSEKKREIIVWQCVLQTVTSLHAVLALEFQARDLLKIANINPQQESQILTMEKFNENILVPSNISFFGSFILRSTR